MDDFYLCFSYLLKRLQRSTTCQKKVEKLCERSRAEQFHFISVFLLSLLAFFLVDFVSFISKALYYRSLHNINCVFLFLCSHLNITFSSNHSLIDAMQCRTGISVLLLGLALQCAVGFARYLDRGVRD